MTQDEIIKNLPQKFVTNDTDYMSAFRHNVLLYLAERDITLQDLAEYSDLSVDTLKSFLYKGLKDCKLSTAVSLARAMGVSVDELIGAGTIEDTTRESFAMCRSLPEHSLHLIRWHIRHQNFLYNQIHKDRIVITIMNTLCQHNGNLELTNDYETLDITELNPDISAKVFFGIKMPCDHYMPTYSHYDILLIANDRDPMNHENTVIIYNGFLAIAKRKVENGVVNFYSIRDGKFRRSENDRIEILGYVAGIYRQ